MNERTCVGCFVRSSDNLLRVKSIDGELHFDLLGKLAGRGCWIHPTVDCLNHAISRRAFQKALRLERPSDSTGLLEKLEEAEKMLENK